MSSFLMWRTIDGQARTGAATAAGREVHLGLCRGVQDSDPSPLRTDRGDRSQGQGGGRLMAATKFEVTIRFSIDDINRLKPGDRSELREFIIDALESWGGQRHPDDWLFGSLEHVTVGPFREVSK